MNELKLYNSLIRNKEEFKPINSPKVGLYCCGPTVYDYQHIGNMRTYIFEDILKRVLEYNGYKVKHVMNITDIGHLVSDADEGEDKMMKALKREDLEVNKTSMMKLADKYTKAFQEDLEKLNIKSPDKYARATKYIKEQVKLIKTLIKKGYTYETSDGIYFDTTKYPEYGKLALLDRQELQAGKRVDLAEKKDIHDFALWKFSKPGENRIMEWKAFGKMGFPGWHLECSAMSMKLLGKHFDIHCGGIDHIPIHHTNERAQNNCSTKTKECVNYWMHGEFLNRDPLGNLHLKNNIHVCPNCNYENLLKDRSNYKRKKVNNGILLLVDCQKCQKSFIGMKIEKMSKSSGGFITLEDLEGKKISPLAYRYFCLMTHYRKPLSFSWEALEAAESGLNNLYSKVKNLGDKKGILNSDFKEKLLTSINDDLNMPQILALISEVLSSSIKNEDKLTTILEFDKVLGLNLDKIKNIKYVLPIEVGEIKTKGNDADFLHIPENINQLAEQRKKARAEKNWKESDKLRDEINKLGWEIEDHDNGYGLKKK